MKPVSITRLDTRSLRIVWDDGTECTHTMAQLRRSCPCASCTTEFERQGPSYIPLFAGDALTLDGIDPVGNYALQFRWKDGHHTGIYTYEYLRSLCSPPTT